MEMFAGRRKFQPMIGFDFPWEAVLGRPSLAELGVRLGAPGPLLATPGLFALFLCRGGVWFGGWHGQVWWEIGGRPRVAMN